MEMKSNVTTVTLEHLRSITLTTGTEESFNKELDKVPSCTVFDLWDTGDPKRILAENTIKPGKFYHILLGKKASYGPKAGNTAKYRRLHSSLEVIQHLAHRLPVEVLETSRYD
ncbi:hypothetical protein [uncultured Vibrio sp.]|uniref:hypothetical protein n=1 Tax=uncultured Vibrio sp. TaxID=114054 RepID=UPI00260ADE41|nr:hypothetical protein [uncultured Vibrio sp.]